MDDHLTTLDAGFLEAEDADPHVSLAIGGVAVLDGPMPDFASLTATLTGRLSSVPRLTQLVHSRPLDLGAPEWVPDKHFDIAHHIRRAALPRPGGDADLDRLVADIMERRLDRSRPLWECWVIEGLSHRRWAVLMKVHHCLADGIAATHMLTALCDDGPAAAAHPDPTPAPPPGVSSYIDPVGWMSSAVRTSFGLTAAAIRAARGALDLVGGMLRPAPLSVLNGPVGTMRRYAAVDVSLSDVRHVCDEFGVTVNDVALAAITSSYRAMLIRRGETPGRNSLRTLVPVSVRAADAGGEPDNRVSMLLPRLPVDKADPLEQLRAVHRRLTQVKGSGQRQAGSAVVSAANAIPFAVTAWAVRNLTRLPQRDVVALASNVPGPQEGLTIMGRDIRRLLPIPPIALQLRTGIAILSYADQLSFGIIGDYDAVPDVDELARGIGQAVGRLAALAAAPHRSTPLRTLALVT
ncbi:diacylglycerol O-acyltransferase [Mycobacterium sp. IS-1496]|uniref:WS/DGAT/MGAT family O-acyltransferase n=1 Tax=Mycobacterium sp. IS-1496 TaxID=1772284 RepID=UPI00074161E8|nr:wax ester/triacylglycerol synthase family O-acyltransferase [Mycobacterium sp. IS-1496]KUI38915.1 diacylglycerol O-acyltransferase [Mycobacterium sp. IS-1496]